MRGVLVIMFVAAFIMLFVHIAMTDVSVKEIEQIEKQSVEFSQYCYKNDYNPKECW
jgi:hypothetical protein